MFSAHRSVFFVFSSFVIMLLSLAGCTTSDLIDENYRLTLIDEKWPQKSFVIDIPSSNQEGIRELKEYLGENPTIDSDGNLEIGIVYGDVQRTEPTFKHPWSYKLAPNSVHFSDFTIELCDGDFEFVENNLDYWMKNVKIYCPWGTKQKLYKIEKFSGLNNTHEVIWVRNK